jgi:hypothetical protein
MITIGGQMRRKSQPQSKDRVATGLEEIKKWLALGPTDPDLFAVAALCVIGYLIAVNLILRFPGFGLAIEQFNLFP